MLIMATATAAARPAPASQPLVEELRALLPASRRRALLEQRLVDHVAAVLRQDTERVQTDRPLKEQGLDSMMTVELRDRLENTWGFPLSRTLVWQYPTVNALADHLLTEMQLLDDQPASTPTPETDPELDSLLSAIEDMPEEAVKDLLDGR